MFACIPSFHPSDRSELFPQILALTDRDFACIHLSSSSHKYIALKTSHILKLLRPAPLPFGAMLAPLPPFAARRYAQTSYNTLTSLT